MFKKSLQRQQNQNTAREASKIKPKKKEKQRVIQRHDDDEQILKFKSVVHALLVLQGKHEGLKRLNSRR